MTADANTGQLRPPRADPGAELWQLWTQRHVWMHMAMADTRSRYRQSTLGSLWIAATTAVLVVSIGLIYGQFFGQDLSVYLPYFATGFVLWTYVAGTINEATTTLIGAGSIIKTSHLPVGFHIMRMLVRSLIVFAHNLLVIAGVWLWFRWNPGPGGLLAIPGFILLTVTLTGASLTLSIVCVRFRDIPPLVAAVTQFAFLASPIIWFPEILRFGQVLLYLNPVTHFLMVTRDPLLGRPTEPVAWITTVAITAATLLVTLWIYRRYRDRVAYWV